MISYEKLKRLLIKSKSEKIIYDIKLNKQNKMINTIKIFSKIS